jgi:hypothetical protein
MKSSARTDLTPIGARSRAEAAELLNVGTTSVDRACHVQRQGINELQQAVESGDVSLWICRLR